MSRRFLPPALVCLWLPVTAVAAPSTGLVPHMSGLATELSQSLAAPATTGVWQAKKKKTHVSGSVGTDGANASVSAGTGSTRVKVNSNGKASVSVKPKGSKVRVGVNSKGKVRIGF